jgi:Serine hydrolase (FSH1)
MTFKVLSLHGSQQNAEILRTRLGRIVPKVKQYASFTFIDAPHVLPLKDGDEVRYDDQKPLVLPTCFLNFSLSLLDVTDD